MKTPHSTKAEQSAAEQGERYFTALSELALRFWCATPSTWKRGRTHTKPKSHDLKQSHATCIFRGFRGFRGVSVMAGLMVNF